MTNRFTHALLHETAHSFHTNFYKMLFNSEEEVFVNLRMLCALHWAGMDSGQMLLTNASSKWTWTDGSVAEQYMYQDRGMISLTDPAYQAYFPESSGVWDLWEMKSTFVPVSVRQNFALSAYTDSSAGRLFARSAAIVSAAADRPVSCSFSDDPSDSNNWLNTDAIDANWETVSEEEWKKLTVLCVSDADHVSLPDAVKDIVKMYCSYLSKCTEELRYYFFVKADGKNVRKEYTVRVTPAVRELISANCKAENGAFRVSGNLIQAFNMFDFMENGMDETLILNQYLRPAPAFRAFCLKTMTADYENRHAFMPTVQTPEIIGQPENADAAVGDTVSFTVEAAGIGMTYQWQYRAGTKWRDSVMTGADTATVCKEVQEGRDMQEYRCIVSWPDGHQEISETALLRIRPTITEQPQNSEAAPGETAIFRAEASGTDLTYQWQFSSGAEWEDSDVTGADTEEIAVPVSAEQDGTLFRCVISGRSGAQTVSDEAELIVRKGITSQPEDIETAEGEDVQFSVGVSGNGVTCQWQFSKGNGWKDSGMTGADSDTVTVPAAFSRDGQQYRCVVSWPDGTQEFSDAAVLRVRPTIVEQPSDVTAPAGFIAVFTAAADGKDLTYQWEVFSGTEWAAADSSGADTDTLRVTAAEAINGQQYRCVITGSSGAQSVSEPAVLTIE